MQDDPTKYIPAWGGFCSYGIADEGVWTVDTLGPFGDPSVWTISLDGKLHVFRRYSEGTLLLYQRLYRVTAYATLRKNMVQEEFAC